MPSGQTQRWTQSLEEISLQFEALCIIFKKCLLNFYKTGKEQKVERAKSGCSPWYQCCNNTEPPQESFWQWTCPAQQSTSLWGWVSHPTLTPSRFCPGSLFLLFTIRVISLSLCMVFLFTELCLGNFTIWNGNSTSAHSGTSPLQYVDKPTSRKPSMFTSV